MTRMTHLYGSSSSLCSGYNDRMVVLYTAHIAGYIYTGLIAFLMSLRTVFIMTGMIALCMILILTYTLNRIIGIYMAYIVAYVMTRMIALYIIPIVHYE